MPGASGGTSRFMRRVVVAIVATMLASLLPGAGLQVADAASITSLSVSSAGPGDQVTIIGSGFGTTQGAQCVHLAQTVSGTTQNWGLPGNASTFVIDSWSDTAITFTVPVPSGTTNQWRLIPGNNSTVGYRAAGCTGADVGSQTLAIVNTTRASDYFTSIRIGSDNNLTCGGLGGTYLSAEALAAAPNTITPGSTIASGAFTFTKGSARYLVSTSPTLTQTVKRA